MKKRYIAVLICIALALLFLVLANFDLTNQEVHVSINTDQPTVVPTYSGVSEPLEGVAVRVVYLNNTTRHSQVVVELPIAIICTIKDECQVESITGEVIKESEPVVSVQIYSTSTPDYGLFINDAFPSGCSKTYPLYPEDTCLWQLHPLDRLSQPGDMRYIIWAFYPYG